MKYMLLLLVILFAGSCLSQKTRKTVAYVKKSVVSLGVVENKKYSVKGSGLMMRIHVKEKDVYVVLTNSHMVDGYRERGYDSFYIRPSWADKSDGFKIVVPINENGRNNFFYHPNSNRDLACIIIPNNYLTEYQKLNKGQIDYCLAEMFEKPEVGESVSMIGYQGFVDTCSVKNGFVIWSTNADSVGEYKNLFFIKAHVAPGDSGGPVISIHHTNRIVGILSSNTHGSDFTNYSKQELISLMSRNFKYVGNIPDIRCYRECR